MTRQAALPYKSCKDVDYEDDDGHYIFKSYTRRDQDGKPFEYSVYLFYTDKYATCQCPDFMFRHKDCKHIKRAWEIDKIRARIKTLIPVNKIHIHESNR